MTKVILERFNGSALKKPVYKLKNGKLIKTFLSVASAAFKAGIPESALYNYIRGKRLKPTKIPIDIEYSYSKPVPGWDNFGADLPPATSGQPGKQMETSVSREMELEKIKKSHKKANKEIKELLKWYQSDLKATQDLLKEKTENGSLTEKEKIFLNLSIISDKKRIKKVKLMVEEMSNTGKKLNKLSINSRVGR